jgi:hypothetical protein
VAAVSRKKNFCGSVNNAITHNIADVFTNQLINAVSRSICYGLLIARLAGVMSFSGITVQMQLFRKDSWRGLDKGLRRGLAVTVFARNFCLISYLRRKRSEPLFTQQRPQTRFIEYGHTQFLRFRKFAARLCARDNVVRFL